MCDIANCFIHVKCKFVIYGEFCSNLPKAQESVDKICRMQSECSEFIAQLNVSV